MDVEARRAVFGEAFGDYPLLVKVAGDLGYVCDMSTDGGERVRLIAGVPHVTVRAFGHMESVLVVHPNDGQWMRERVSLIRKDGSEANPNFWEPADSFETDVVDELPVGYWGMDTHSGRMTEWVDWVWLVKNGMKFLTGDVQYKEVAERHGLVWLDDVGAAVRRKARFLHWSGWKVADYLVFEELAI